MFKIINTAVVNFKNMMSGKISERISNLSEIGPRLQTDEKISDALQERIKELENTVSTTDWEQYQNVLNRLDDLEQRYKNHVGGHINSVGIVERVINLETWKRQHTDGHAPGVYDAEPPEKEPFIAVIPNDIDPRCEPVVYAGRVGETAFHCMLTRIEFKRPDGAIYSIEYAGILEQAALEAKYEHRLIGQCKNCKSWDEKEAFNAADNPNIIRAECRNKEARAVMCAFATDDNFGCIYWEAKE